MVNYAPCYRLRLGHQVRQRRLYQRPPPWIRNGVVSVRDTSCRYTCHLRKQGLEAKKDTAEPLYALLQSSPMLVTVRSACEGGPHFRRTRGFGADLTKPGWRRLGIFAIFSANYRWNYVEKKVYSVYNYKNVQ